jgi:DNA helicase-2/ATP-dependent DNA helicase PcrA
MDTVTLNALDLADEETQPKKTTCPICNSDMKLRNGARGPFWGCSRFPKCKGTRNASEGIKQYAPALRPEYKPAPDRKWSKYQEDVFSFVKSCKDKPGSNVVIEAVAGSGKTVTIVKALEYTPTDSSVAFLAFNKHIADELKTKVPPHVYASTIHSLCYANVRAVLGNVTVDENKCGHILRTNQKAARGRMAEIMDESHGEIIKIVSLLKNLLLEPTDENLDYIVDRYGISVNGDDDFIYTAARDIYHQSLNQIKQQKLIDYDDMIFACASPSVNIACRKFDYIFGDEVQDWNTAQITIVLKSISKNGHIVAVGDRKQSIYGFRGADVDAIPNVIKALNATVLPLSICYRCPKSHVALAQKLVPQIEAAETAADGIVRRMESHAALDYMKDGDMVICRTNAPLVRPAFALIRQGIKATIRGRDIGTGLNNLVAKVMKKYGSNTLEQMLSDIQSYGNHEIEKLTRREKFTQAQTLLDQVETIFAISEGVVGLNELKERITKIFDDKVAGIVFSSVHKAKGLESDRVFILHEELMPHKMAKRDFEIQQEYNCIYIAFTRAKKELIFVEGEL